MTVPPFISKNTDRELMRSIRGLSFDCENEKITLIYRSPRLQAICRLVFAFGVIFLAGITWGGINGLLSLTIGLGLAFIGLVGSIVQTTIVNTPQTFSWRQSPVAFRQTPFEVQRPDLMIFSGHLGTVSAKGSSTTVFSVSLRTTTKTVTILDSMDNLEQAKAVATLLNRFYGLDCSESPVT